MLYEPLFDNYWQNYQRWKIPWRAAPV